MVARHPLDSDNSINIQSRNSNNNSNANHHATDDVDAAIIWKPPASIGLDLDESSSTTRVEQSLLLGDDSESPPPPATANFCEDQQLHPLWTQQQQQQQHPPQEQQQEEQQQQTHPFFLTATTTTTTTPLKGASPTSTPDNNHHLEDRIADLEFKLATLSRLWQAQESSNYSHSRSAATRRGSLRNGRAARSGGALSPLHSTLPPRPHASEAYSQTPTRDLALETDLQTAIVDDDGLEYDDDDDSYSRPYLESPGPPCLLRRRKGKQRRTLSFALLYGEGLDSIHHPTSSPDQMLLSDNDSNADLIHTPMILSSEEDEVVHDKHQPPAATIATIGSAINSPLVHINVLKPRASRRRPLQPRLQEEETMGSVSGDLEPPPSSQTSLRQQDEQTFNTTPGPSTTFESVALLTPSTSLDPPVESETPLSPSNTTTAAAAVFTEDPSTRVRNKWLDYLNSVQEATDDSVESQMAEFIQVPQKVEALQSFGFMICCDSFLYVLVILPIRFIWSCLLLSIYALVPNSKKRPRSNSNTMTQQPFIPKPYRFHRRHMYQLIQVGIIYTIYRHVLCPISIGKLYHWIRGQEMIKLYVLVAMVEVFDRLMCSLGQDCLDSMYWNTTRQPRTRRMIISVLVVWVYATMHTLILFIHVATLNVAMNSSDQALLTLLISGNFAEIKSTVFKKYNKPLLFKLTASDICERFKLALFMGLVLILNLCQGGGMDHGMVGEFTTMCGFVWCAELLSDWIKHAFVTKSNNVKSSVYAEFGLLLAGDVTGFGHEGVNMDHSHAVVKRLGFPQIPLVCVMGRYITEALRYYQQASYDSTALLVQQQQHHKLPSSMERMSKNVQYRIILAGFGIWLVLLLIKIGLGSFLQRKCRNKLLSAPELSVTSSSKKKKKKE